MEKRMLSKLYKLLHLRGKKSTGYMYEGIHFCVHVFDTLTPKNAMWHKISLRAYYLLNCCQI